MYVGTQLLIAQNLKHFSSTVFLTRRSKIRVSGHTAIHRGSLVLSGQFLSAPVRTMSTGGEVSSEGLVRLVHNPPARTELVTLLTKDALLGEFWNNGKLPVYSSALEVNRV